MTGRSAAACHLRCGHSELVLGAMVLSHLDRPSTVSGLWEVVADKPETGSFHNFVLTLDYLYAIGAIDYERGLLIKATRLLLRATQ